MAVLIETQQKPSLNHLEKNPRTILFSMLDNVLSLSDQKIHAKGNSDSQKRSWARVLVSAVGVYGALLKDSDLESLEVRLQRLERGEKP